MLISPCTFVLLLLGTSPLAIKPSTGLRKELIEKEQQSKGEQEGQFELISKVDMFSVFSYYVKCEEVCFWD